jgi:hypothetical protein
VTWNTQTSNFGTTIIYSVAYGNGVWVAAGGGGTLRTSTDTVNWNTQTSGFTTNISSVAYGNGVWTAVAGSALRTSTDNAVTWNTQTSNFGTTIIYSVAYGNGVWAIASAGGNLRTSGTETITLPNFNLLGNSVYGWMKT